MSFLFGRPRTSDLQVAADRLHDSLVDFIRQPVFYTAHGVPDTFEGRFDLLVLHVALVIRRLRELGTEGQDLAQHLTETMFRRFDIALRELGVSDVAVPKRMKRLAEAFKGRTAAYDEALTAGDDMKLASAVSRNVLGIEAESEELTRYIVAADARTQTMTLSPFQQGAVPFPDPAFFVTRPL